MSQVSNSPSSTQGNTQVDQSTLSDHLPLGVDRTDPNDPRTDRMLSKTGSPVVWWAATNDGKKPDYAAFVFEDGTSIVGEWHEKNERDDQLTSATLTSERSRQGASLTKTADRIGYEVTQKVDSTVPWSGRGWQSWGKDPVPSGKPSVARKGVSEADPDAIQFDPLPPIPTTVSQAPTLRAKTDDEPTAIETTSHKTKFGSLAKGIEALRKLKHRTQGSSSKS